MDDTKEITIISKEVEGIYLSYIAGNYTYYFKDGSITKYQKSSAPTDLFDNIIATQHDDDRDNDIKLAISNIQYHVNCNKTKAEKIFTELIEDLHQLYFDTNPSDLKKIITERVEGINNPKIKEKFIEQKDDFEKSKYIDIVKSIRGKLETRKSGKVDIARRELSKYLTIKYGAILRKNIGELYVIDGAGYTKIEHDDMILNLKKDFGNNFIHDDDLKKAMGYISDRRSYSEYCKISKHTF